MLVNWEGMQGMQVAWGWYSPGHHYLSRSVFHLRYRDCASPKCSSGRCTWDGYFTLTSTARKQVLTLYYAPPFCFFLSSLPHPTNFNIPEPNSNRNATTDTGTRFTRFLLLAVWQNWKLNVSVAYIRALFRNLSWVAEENHENFRIVAEI